MASSVFPAQAGASDSGSTAFAITCASPNAMYSASNTFEPGIYSVTCVSSTVATVYFHSGVSNLITTAVTVSGSTTINLGSSADRIRVWTNTGSDITVSITLVASPLTNNFSGTIDTVTTTSTYAGTSTSGYGYILACGGGGAGGWGWDGGYYSQYAGGGGGAGSTGGKLVALTGSLPIVIGGAGLNVNGNAGGNGGTTTAGGISAGGGIGGRVGTYDGSPGAGGTSTGGSVNVSGASGTGRVGSGGSQGSTPGSGGSPTSAYPFVTSTDSLNNAGYSLGGRGGTPGQNGIDGGAGVVYILRF
jgi:hypothetical protein